MSTKSNRQRDLAKIHIAKKDLGLDDETYRYIIKAVGKVESGKSSDLDYHGRQAVLAHFQSKGWKTKRKLRPGKPIKNRTKFPGMASAPQIRLIHHLWNILVDANVIESTTDGALRAWIQSNTKRFTDNGMGFSAPEFMTSEAARDVIEQLKRYASRNNLEWQ